MLLRIQSEETLRSYVERNLFLNWEYSPVRRLFEQLSKVSLGTSEVRAIATAMGWQGCYGFNRLLHHHTKYPTSSIFKNIQDMAYSGDRYLRSDQCYEFRGNVSKFCPECVRVDLIQHGFSYWRRLHFSSVKVCAKHNLMLEISCPFCGKPFSSKGHSLDVMWKTCDGRHLGESPQTRNYDILELKKSKLYEDAASFMFHISEEAALSVLYEKILSLSAQSSPSRSELLLLYGQIERALSGNISGRLASNGHFIGHGSLIFESIQIAYGDFEEFIDDVKRHDHGLRAIDSLWSTYRAGGSESANYVDEDYTYGVGHWSCPYPSPLSAERYSNDGCRSRRPKIYSCCNVQKYEQKGHKLNPVLVGPPSPRIPVMGREICGGQ